MAREYARIRLSIAADASVEALSPMAQWLYFRVLIPDPKLTHCGVTDWRPNRLLGKASGLTLALIMGAAVELEQARYALFDTDTEEVLVRAYIRSEELMRNPKHAVAVASAYLSVASRPLRAAIASELHRDRAEHPDYSSWKHSISRDAVELLLNAPTSDQVPYVDTIAKAVGKPNTITEATWNANGIGNRNGKLNGDAHPGAEYQPEHQADSLHLVPNTLTPAPIGSYVGRERHQGTAPASTPFYANRCLRHAQDPHPPACGACADARRTSEDLQAAVDAAAKQLLAECPDCDEYGWSLGDDGKPIDPARRCHHPTLTEEAAHG
ncbi:hypothetical protein BCA37_10655 [Mycobacterium sp. djl-10]|nr:hypothetical protein BCA37_10655 [Mycobacterium sp. djl-10]